MNKTRVARQANTSSFLLPGQGLLQRKCACGNHTVAGGECAECARNKSGLQRKLTIGASNDPLEQEADRMAEQVLAASAHSTVGGAPLHIQRYAGQTSGDIETAPASVDRVLASSGRPLEPALRQDMGQRFGYDFSQVRVHSDEAAEQSAQEVKANAYTVGHNIVFGAGRFTPGTHEGRRLIAHELTHVVQQSATQSLLQRDLGFEFQLHDNTITTNKGRPFPRKAGKFFHRVPPADKHGLELQTDSGSFMEFETHHFQKWSDLEVQIKNAVDVVQEIKKDPKAFPFNQEKRFRAAGLLAKDETLEVNVKDSAFIADIQSTEGIALTQYASLLKEHERDPTLFVDPVLKDAQDILNAASAASKKVKAGASLDNLRGFLQIIINYVRRGQHELWDKANPDVVKSTFRLLMRVDFVSVFQTLTADEKTLFREIVKSGAIPKAVGLAAGDPFFKAGYWGDLGGGVHAFFELGKITALSAKGKVHDCAATTKTKEVDSRRCGKKIAGTAITVGSWLESIVKQKKDVLSPASHGSESMGQFPVPSKGSEKGLAIFEVRDTVARNRQQPASKWVDYADGVFSQAAACRARAGTGTGLNYDGTKKFDPKNCP
ncbi:MAG: DUF4157 domain-containing protein [Aquabacterium sp.]|nr:DUF4157 domain-containing protein [Aquabacterium sp.]